MAWGPTRGPQLLPNYFTRFASRGLKNGYWVQSIINLF